MLNSENGNTNVNVVNDKNSEFESTCKYFLVSKRIWKQYDRYAFSNYSKGEKNNVSTASNTMKADNRKILNIETYVKNTKK